MFSGIQEILLIALILLGIFLMPRMMSPKTQPKKAIVRRPARKLSWRLRLSIVLSVLWPLFCAAYFRPWNEDILHFAVIGLGPVVLGWSVKWIMEGMKR
jgi:predicted Na+-dependent transporter